MKFSRRKFIQAGGLLAIPSIAGRVTEARSLHGAYQPTVIFYGQSNMNGMVNSATGQSTGSPPAAAAGTTYFDDANSVWGPVPPIDGLRIVLNAVAALKGSARGINGSVNATGVEFLMDTTPITGGLGQFAPRLALAGVSTADLICWMQGEGNTNEDRQMQERDYLADLDTMHINLATMMGKTRTTLPLIVAGLTTYGATDFPNTDSSWQAIRRALFNSQTQLAGVTYSHSNMDGVRQPADIYHLDGASQARNGARFAQTIKSVLGSIGTPAHWQATGGTIVDATHTDITLGLVGTATDFTPTSGITGFDVTGDNGATWTSVTGARQSATSIRLTHSSLTTTNVRKVRYQYGMLPDVSGPVKDNSTLALPLNFTPDEITPTPLSTIPRPDYTGNAFDNNQAGTTQTDVGIPIGPATARRLVIVGLAGSSVGYTSCTITPNVGTAKTATLIQSSAITALAYALLDADADTATTVTITVVYPSSPFAQTQIDVWTIPSAQLSSTTPSAIAGPNSTTNTTTNTITIPTPAQGFVIAYAWSAGGVTGTISGTEAYANRNNPHSFKITAAADACNTSSNASSSITATFGASGNTSLVAAVWH